MTPSNPNNQQPLIYRIADALGVFHLVAPVDHTHLTTEVSGLTEALAAKANAAAVETALAGKMDNKTIDSAPTVNSTNLVTSGGVAAALDKKDSINQVDEDDEQEAHLNAVAEDDDIYFKFRLKNGSAEKQVLLTMPKMDNFERALEDPNSTPTANSENLVTSGGVAAALAAKANKDDVEFKVFEKNAASDKINLSTDFAQGQKRATYVISNYTSDACALSDLFTYQSGDIATDIILPATEQPAIQVDGTVVVSVLKYSDDSAINYIIVPESYY